MKSKCWFLPAISLVVVTGGGSLPAKDYMDSSRALEQIAVQEMVFSDRFRTADSACHALIRRSPFDPMGYLLLATALVAECTDQEENLYPDSLPALLRSVDSLAETALDSCTSKTKGWMHLARGHARALRSVFEARFGSVASAIKQGFRARSEYRKALANDSTLYDVYAGLGSFHYWKSAKAGFLRWIGLFKNEKAKGIEELTLAADSSSVSRESARASLIWIWINEEKYDSAIALALAMHKRYPDGSSFIWPLAQAHQLKLQYDSSLMYYTQLRDRIAHRPGNFYNQIECDAAIVRCYELLGDKTTGLAAAQRLTEYYQLIPDETRRRQRSKLGYLKQMASGH